MYRACGGKQYSRICALFITWDWNGNPAEDTDFNDELEFLPSKQYRFDTRTLRLPANKSRKAQSTEMEHIRDADALSVLNSALFDIFSNYPGSNTLFIVHYNGQVCLENRFYDRESLYRLG